MKQKVLLRLVACVLAILFLLPFVFSLRANAASGSATIGLSNRSVYVGNYVYVTVTYSSSTPMATWSFGINYDSAKLKYISGAHSTTGGTLNFVDQPTSGGITSKSYTITFQAIALGEASVSTVTREVYAEDYSSISVSEASRTVSVIERPAASGENRLSALSAEGVELSPNFDQNTADYTARVPYAVRDLTFTATALHSAASVSVSGADALSVGENVIKIVVTAENSSARTYTVTVTREDSPFVGAAVSMDGEEYTFVRDESEAQKLPEGFAPKEGEYQGEDVLLFENETGSVTLAVLQHTGEADKITEHLFVYEREKETFSPYLSVETEPQSFVFLNPGEDVPIPEGFSPSSLAVKETEISAWVNSPEAGESPVTLVYASPIFGTAAFYAYDATTGSFTLYSVPEPELSEDGKTMEEMEAALAEEREKSADLMKYWNYTVLVGLGLCLLLLIVILILAIVAHRAKKRAKKAQSEHIAAPESEYDAVPHFAPVLPVIPVVPERSSQEEERDTERTEDLYGEPQETDPFAEETADGEASDGEAPVFAAPPQVNELSASEEAEIFAEPESQANPEESLPEVTPKVEAAPAAEVKTAPSVPLWEELAAQEKDDFDILAPSRPKSEKDPFLPPRDVHPEVERIFGTVGEDELFRKNNPIIDEDEEEGDDAPVYGFDEE